MGNVSEWEPGLPQIRDSVAEDVLMGLLLTGVWEAYEYCDVEPKEFENVQYRLIWEALQPLRGRDTCIPPADIRDALDNAELIESGEFSLPESWYLSIAEQATRRVVAAMKKDNMTLPEAVMALSLRVRLAYANYVDANNGNYYRQEILLSEATTLEELYEDVMLQGGYLAAYLKDFKPESRLFILNELKYSMEA